MRLGKTMQTIDLKVPSRTNRLALGLNFIKKQLYIAGVFIAFFGLLGIVLLYEIKQSFLWIFQGKPPESIYDPDKI